MLKACKSSQAGKCLKSILCSILLAYPAMKVYPAYIITADNHQADTISRLQTPPEFLTLQITPLTRRSNLIDITYRRKSCYPKSLLHCSCTRYRTSSGQECSDASFKVEIIHRVLSCYAPRFSNIEKLFASRPHYYNGLLCRGIMNVSLSFVSPNLTQYSNGVSRRRSTHFHQQRAWTGVYNATYQWYRSAPSLSQGPSVSQALGIHD